MPAFDAATEEKKNRDAYCWARDYDGIDFAAINKGS